MVYKLRFDILLHNLRHFRRFVIHINDDASVLDHAEWHS